MYPASTTPGVSTDDYNTGPAMYEAFYIGDDGALVLDEEAVEDDFCPSSGLVASHIIGNTEGSILQGAAAGAMGRALGQNGTDSYRGDFELKVCAIFHCTIQFFLM